MVQFKSYGLFQPESRGSSAPSARGRIHPLPKEVWSLKNQSHVLSGKEGVLRWGAEKETAVPSQDDEEVTALGHRHACELKRDMTAAMSLRPAVPDLHRKSYNMHTTGPCDGRKTHACLGDTPQRPASVQALYCQVLHPHGTSRCSTPPNAYNHPGGDTTLETEMEQAPGSVFRQKAAMSQLPPVPTLPSLDWASTLVLLETHALTGTLKRES